MGACNSVAVSRKGPNNMVEGVNIDKTLKSQIWSDKRDDKNKNTASKMVPSAPIGASRLDARTNPPEITTGNLQF